VTREISDGLQAAAAQVNKGRAISELSANHYFSAQTGPAESDGFVNLRFDDNSLTPAAVACLMVKLNGEQAYCPVQIPFRRLTHS